MQHHIDTEHISVLTSGFQHNSDHFPSTQLVNVIILRHWPLAENGNDTKGAFKKPVSQVRYRQMFSLAAPKE